MKNALLKVNLIGVLLLTALCVLQWRAQYHLQGRYASLEKQHDTLQRAKEEGERMLTEAKGDLEQFRAQVMQSHQARKEAEKSMTAVRSELLDLSAERDRLHAVLITWKEAVTARDQRLEQLQRTLDESVKARNDVVEKFNLLARSQNQAVERLNAALAELARLRTNSVGKANPKAPVSSPAPPAQPRATNPP